MAILIRGRVECWSDGWSREATIWASIGGPVLVLTGMAAGHWWHATWSFLLPLAGLGLGLGLAELGALSVLRNSDRWFPGSEPVDSQESECPDE